MNQDKDQEDYSPSAPDSNQSSGPFLAKVVGHLDPTYMGTLEVELLRPVGNAASEGQIVQVKMMTPFWGQTDVNHVGEDPNDYNNTQKAYGMWFVPPDPGTIVVVMFIDGDTKRGYWIGCVPDENMNFSVPGVAATQYVVEGGGRIPVAEYNKKNNATPADPTQVKKPRHPIADVLEAQGLLKDDVRGITTSSARREVPSAVFGISTPGPIDKRSGAKQGKVGKEDQKITTFVSRLGGTSFVMDDGDDKFLRKTKPNAGPPEYASVSEGEKGLADIPHNELVRIRTRTGHQILLHNSEDLIYISNAKGTTWIEMTSNGKIDIFAKDSISVHSDYDINFHAGRDINMTSVGNINLNATGNANLTSTGDTNLNGKSIKATGATIDLNGPAAAKATKVARIPRAEPWAGHENLNPTAFTPDKVKAATAPVEPTGAAKYSTTVDPFSKIKGAE